LFFYLFFCKRYISRRNNPFFFNIIPFLHYPINLLTSV
jgi:hypothetical protein